MQKINYKGLVITSYQQNAKNKGRRGRKKERRKATRYGVSSPRGAPAPIYGDAQARQANGFKTLEQAKAWIDDHGPLSGQPFSGDAIDFASIDELRQLAQEDHRNAIIHE